MNDKTIELMDEFAKEGLRTLMFAKRTLTSEVTDQSLKEMPTEDYE